MPNTFRHPFDDLPLVTDMGFEAFLVSVEADISYWPDGSWTITGLTNEGHKANKHTLEQHVAAQRAGRPLKPYTRRPVALEVGAPLYSIILHVLEHPWKSKVDEAVREEMFQQKCHAIDFLTDRTIDLRKHETV